MLFQYPEFTLFYNSYQHMWELMFHKEDEFQARMCTIILDLIEHHNLDAPMLIWREDNTSFSFAALRVMERRATRVIPAIACISSNLSTRRALEITFNVLIKHPRFNTFTTEDEARDWLIRTTRPQKSFIPSVQLHAPIA